MEERARVTEATPQDWEDFWHNEDIIVNMDGGVGGSWREVSLPENNQEPFIPSFHD
jgi:hypothetical protein